MPDSGANLHPVPARAQCHCRTVATINRETASTHGLTHRSINAAAKMRGARKASAIHQPPEP